MKKIDILIFDKNIKYFANTNQKSWKILYHMSECNFIDE